MLTRERIKYEWNLSTINESPSHLNALSFMKFRNKFSHEFFMRIGDFLCVRRTLVKGRSTREDWSATSWKRFDSSSCLLDVGVALLGRFNFQKGRKAKKTKWLPLGNVPGPALLVATCYANVSAFYQFSNLHKKSIGKISENIFALC